MDEPTTQETQTPVVVEHPDQPGVAAEKVVTVSYRVLEEAAERQKLDELESQFESVSDEYDRLESAVEAQKSLVEGIDAVASTETSVDSGTDGTSSETETPVEGDSTSDVPTI